MAEYWHAGTLEISAASLRTKVWAHVEDSAAARGVLGGADITTSWEQDYGLKYCKDGKSSAIEQATTVKQRYNAYLRDHPECTELKYLKEHGLDENTDMNLPLYEGQARLIPAGQLKDARYALQKRIDHDLAVGGEQAKDVPALIQTRDSLTDHIEGPDGEKSFPLSYEQAKQIQKCAKNGSFDPEQFDITAARLADKSFILTNAVKAGYNAAWTSALLKVVPEIVAILKKAVDDDIITYDDLKKLGSSVAEGSALGFIRGVFTSSLTTTIELGYWGETLQKASLSPEFPSAIAVVVTTAISIAHDSISLAKKQITKEEYTYRVEKTIFIASTSYICGVAVQGLLIEMPTLGYILGSFVGSVLGGVVFEVKEKAFLSLCVENGWTFFGFVDQEYELPEEIARKFGFDELEYDKMEYEKIKFDDIEYDDIKYDDIHYDKLDIVLLKRGVIGIRKIGYIEAH